MLEIIELLIHFVATVIKLLKPGGVKVVMAETIVMKQQLIEMKSRNPSFGYGRISMQIFEAFGISISRFAVGRILRKNKHNLPSGDGPSWLTSIGHFKDSLWSRGAVQKTYSGVNQPY
jgi:hypothetical protein